MPTHVYSSEHEISPAMTTNLQAALRTMKTVMTPSFFEGSPALKGFYTKVAKSIEVRESPIEGLGLFATKSIKANTIVGFYPAHALGIDGEPFQCFVEDTEYFRCTPSATSQYLHCTDQPIFQRVSILSSDDPVYLDVNPTKAVVRGWVSHYINDGACPSHQSEESILEYYKRSNAARNCIHIPFGPSPILATITTKKVKKGSELLTSYGGVYWAKDSDVSLTPAIQAEVRASAQDLRKSMQQVAILYQSEISALNEAYGRAAMI